MTQEDSPPRGGAPAVTAGNLAVALSVVAALAAGPRVLGHASFAGFSLAWTAITVFGYGLAMPTEQLISRRRNADPAADVSRVVHRLLLLAAAASAAALSWAARSPAAETFPHLGVTTVVGILGWTLAAITRGKVAGSGNLRRYAGLFAVEAVLRIAFVVAALVAPADVDALLMAAALGTPVVAAGLVGAIGVRGSLLVRATAEVRTPRAEQLSFILVALGYQACLNAAPFVLERTLVQAPGLVGAFVITSSYYRFASVLAGGFTTPALVRLSQAWARRDAAGFSEMLRTSVVGVAVASGVATVAAAVASPIVLPLLYGRDPDVPTSVVVGLTASTVLATTAAVAGTALMAAHRAVTAATLWLSGAVFVLAVVALDPGLGVVTSVGLVTGPAVVLVGVGVAITRAGRALGKGSSSQPDPA